MPSLPQSTPPPPPIDLSRHTEETRRALYKATVEMHFTWTPEEIADAVARDDWVLDYTAEEAGVQIVCLFGRWFTWWRALDVKDDFPPQVDRWVIMTIEQHAESPYGVGFGEI